MGLFCVCSSLRLSSRLHILSVFVCVSTCASLPLSAQLVINEIYYDHVGADAGYEFIELMNVSTEAIDLDGVSLEFHNGAGAGWSVLWRGNALDSVSAGGLFVVGGEFVRPPPDVVMGLSLQNGPDALGVFAAGVALDLVGYGGFSDPLYTEGSGAAPVRAGESTARIPDGHDSGDNFADFSARSPSPTRYNVARFDAFPVLAPGTPARAVFDHGVAGLVFLLVNGGTESIATGALTLDVRDSTAAGVTDLGRWSNAAAIAPGESERGDVPLVLGDGYHWITLTTIYSLDERPENDEVAVLRRVGSPPLLVSEVLSSPPPGCPQFVEVYNAGAAPVSIAGYGLRDRSHDAVVVADGTVSVAPGAFVVFTSDAAALFGCFDAPSEYLFQVDGTWPTFNRTGGEVADSVVFVDHLGLAVDAVAIPAVPTAAAGRSLERVGLYRGGAGVTWVLSREAGGASPGRAGARVLYEPPPPGAVEVWPNPFFPDEGVLTIAINATGSEHAVVTIFDTRGRRVAGVGVAGAFPAVLVWNGRDDGGREVLPGLYVLACEFDVDIVKVVIGCGRR